MHTRSPIMASLTELRPVTGLTPVQAEDGASAGPATHKVVITDEGFSRPVPA